MKIFRITREEKIKKKSIGLRGTILDSLKDQLSGGLYKNDQIIIKFHGLYQQDNRDIREERSKKKLDRLYSFMIRLRIPGGGINHKQWMSIHNISKNSTGVIKITSRQTIQLHGLIKSKIKPTIQHFNLYQLDSIATCGDVNRNVVCSTYINNKYSYHDIFSYATKISNMFLPKTKAYYEIWLEQKKIYEKKEEKDPLYHETYLPRKFKIAISVPPNNDVDVFANDVGLIAIFDKNMLKGFNISVGGGLSTTHGNSKTYSRLGTIIGFYDADENKIFKIVYGILTIQRDYGNRSDRKLARLKYTIDHYGINWFKKELENRIGFSLKKEKPFLFTERRDYFGWIQDNKQLWNYTFFVENGLIFDKKDLKLKSALLQIAKREICDFLFTCNQNITLTHISEKNKNQIESILLEYGIDDYMRTISSVRRNSMACVALNTCPLAMAEGQRYLPSLISKIEIILKKYKLKKEDIIIRMTGCPNGCSRPYLAEIGFIGVSYGKYNLYLGANYEGTRLNKLYKKNMDESSILKELDVIFNCFQSEKFVGERFGDFSIRKKWVI
jgi:Sulfite reductase, beta subunit (hemoprotein)